MAKQDQGAETIALQALGWLVANDDLLPVFLGATGASEADLRSSAGSPAFLAAVLDFLLMDDAWIIACADDIAIAPERLAEARRALPGGEGVHWT
ncbi:DUF3572 domain-containing protein [Sulfitobacter sp. HNIBRBA3233]|uniref:DUF3572 domain-containing protein n=1 Tax=Sulfitobacter marinivivus TaxID=3158558 RepID=UPI0032DF63E7